MSFKKLSNKRLKEIKKLGKEKSKINNIPIPIAIIIAAIIIAATLFATQEKDPMYLECLKKWGYYDTYNKDSKRFYKERCR